MTKKEQRKLEAEERRKIREAERLTKQSWLALDKENRAAAREQAIVTTRIRKVTNLYTSTIRGIIATVKEQGPESITVEQLKDWGRNLGTNIFDITGIWSGMMSIELKRLLDVGKKKADVACNEHFLPRQVAGEIVIRHIIRYKALSFEHFLKMVEEFIRVHRVTKDENTKLIPFQKSEIFEGWEQAYKQAGIELVQVKVIVDNS